ncbi:hypothetical protein BHWA1_02156 [Brachyspira hyodysenteriae WA1]|uniref:Uncharacterized protein n=1 Tax=Brachyspira hyodysenteriae (strain ATCC 49526 / WA1) TaxID=565034 RepID=A0A3B6VH96_BRAHW|nr:hypothetical protein BHWA1_02156 [Brachyspira hyodysenteriae WA1]
MIFLKTLATAKYFYLTIIIIAYLQNISSIILINY